MHASSDKYRALYLERLERIDREQKRSKTTKGGLGNAGYGPDCEERCLGSVRHSNNKGGAGIRMAMTHRKRSTRNVREGYSGLKIHV